MFHYKNIFCLCCVKNKNKKKLIKFTCRNRFFVNSFFFKKNYLSLFLPFLLKIILLSLIITWPDCEQDVHHGCWAERNDMMYNDFYDVVMYPLQMVLPLISQQNSTTIGICKKNRNFYTWYLI